MSQHQQDHGYNHGQILANLTHQYHIQRENNNNTNFRVYEPTPPTTLVGLSQDPETMLSEMFSFGHHGLGSDWFGPTTRQVASRDSIEDHHSNNPTHHAHISNINLYPAAAMQLFATNPPQRPPPPPPAPHPYWSSEINDPSELHGVVEGHGLSLSLSSKQGEEESPFFNNFFQQTVIHNLASVDPGLGLGSSTNTGQPQVHIGFGLRNSKYLKAAQELLEEFCSVGRNHLKKAKLSRQDSVNPDPSTSGAGGGSPRKDPPQLSASERVEHQRRKVKLVSMMDEVDRRYDHYCQQMQKVITSFDQVMGKGAAIPYTGLAQKAMSKHFRCLKDGIQEQLRLNCKTLGETDPTTHKGLSKGETPRLKLLEQSLRRQRSFHQNQLGLVIDQEAWRPQRGLPERSVNILRSWLFEHFLHPYPSDADKITLSRQTGLSRNQVSNWFINARVRLWKPMVEEMYQKESKDAQQEHEDECSDQGESQDHNQTYSTNNFTNTTNNNNFCNNTTIIQQTQPITFPPNNYSSPSTCYSASTAHVLPPATTSTTIVGLGTSSGDVSLTLGLQHAGNTMDRNVSFSFRSFPS